MEKYDYKKQAQMLTKHPEEIYTAWDNAVGMFKIIGENVKPSLSGCLTMIRGNNTRPIIKYKAVINGVVNEVLTKEIENDERLPMDSNDIYPRQFPAFIEWQTKIDALEKVGV